MTKSTEKPFKSSEFYKTFSNVTYFEGGKAKVKNKKNLTEPVLFVRIDNYVAGGKEKMLQEVMEYFWTEISDNVKTAKYTIHITDANSFKPENLKALL